MALLWHCYTYVKGEKGAVLNKERTKMKQTAPDRLTF